MYIILSMDTSPFAIFHISYYQKRKCDIDLLILDYIDEIIIYLIFKTRFLLFKIFSTIKYGLKYTNMRKNICNFLQKEKILN